MTSIALCIPHLPGIPKRDESFSRLRRALSEGTAVDRHVTYRILTEKEPNHVWAAKMRRFFIESGAEFCLTLQDDVLVSPRFWAELRAMLTHLPQGEAALGLSSVHPMQTEVYRQGLRWYATRAWLVGWAWGMWREDVIAYDAWCTDNAVRVARTNEDSMLNEWLIETGRTAWHPVPAICDHDTSIESTYANDAHVHRRPLITWRDVDADLTRPEYWLASGKDPPLLAMPLPHVCWACRKEAGNFRWETGVRMCGRCITNAVASKVMG
jgi:hypothetical protein